MDNWREPSAGGGLLQPAIHFSPTNCTNYTNYVHSGSCLPSADASRILTVLIRVPVCLGLMQPES